MDDGAHVSLFVDADVDRKSSREVIERVNQALDQLAPAVPAIPGWSHPAALCGLAWSPRNSRSAVLMSESTAGDEPRRLWREWIKRRLVRLFAAALVGGDPQAAYVRALGMSTEGIFPRGTTPLTTPSSNMVRPRRGRKPSGSAASWTSRRCISLLRAA
jgi:hypothetical protein